MTTEWVLTDKLGSVHKNARVQLDIGTNTLRGYVNHVYRNGEIDLKVDGAVQFRLSVVGWTVYVYTPDRTNGLPTEAGAYVDKSGIDIWTIAEDGFELRCTVSPLSQAADFAPFTRLVAANEILQQVIDAVVPTDDTGAIETIEDLADTYGVVLQ